MVAGDNPNKSFYLGCYQSVWIRMFPTHWVLKIIGKMGCKWGSKKSSWSSFFSCSDWRSSVMGQWLPSLLFMVLSPFHISLLIISCVRRFCNNLNKCICTVKQSGYSPRGIKGVMKLKLFQPTAVGNFMPYPEEIGRGAHNWFHNYMKIQVTFRGKSFPPPVTARVKTQAC